MASPESDERRINAWIGHGVEIEGRIFSSQDLRIDGKVEGTIEVASDGRGEGQPFTGTLLPDQAVLLH